MIGAATTLPALARQGTKAPAAVTAAFKAAYPAATIKHVSKEVEKGETIYEIESVDAGRNRDLLYHADGKLISYEEALTEAEVPAAVTAALKARYPKATVTRRERLVEGQKVSIELGLRGASVGEAVLTPDGAWISPKP